jgi:hypothetical protein
VKRYVVTSPVRWAVVPVTDDGMGPSEPHFDVYLVDAPNRKAAKWAAWKHAQLCRDMWWLDHDIEHPLAGVTIEEAPDEDPASWPDGSYVASGGFGERTQGPRGAA